jgi:hypothetical protein
MRLADEATDPVVAADLFTKAYRALPEGSASDVRAYVITIAIVHYRLALEQASLNEDDEKWEELLRSEAELLEDFVMRSTSDTIPPNITEEYATVGRLLEELQTTPEEGNDVQGEHKALRPRQVQAPKSEPPRDSTSTHKVPGAAALGFGIASLVGGTALIAGGGWMFVETNKRRDTYIAMANVEIAAADPNEAQRESDQAMIDRFRSSLGAFEEQSRSQAAALVGVGSLLVASGIGLTTWGIIRARRPGPRSRARLTMIPTCAARRVGLHIDLAF